MVPGDYSKGKHAQCLRTVLEASDISERRTFTNPLSGIILAIPPTLSHPSLSHPHAWQSSISLRSTLTRL